MATEQRRGIVFNFTSHHDRKFFPPGKWTNINPYHRLTTLASAQSGAAQLGYGVMRPSANGNPGLVHNNEASRPPFAIKSTGGGVFRRMFESGDEHGSTETSSDVANPTWQHKAALFN